MTTTTDNPGTPATEPITLAKLQANAVELRTAMGAALTAMEDAKVRKLRNELPTVN